jgi:HlyD family secretion protein
MDRKISIEEIRKGRKKLLIKWVSGISLLLIVFIVVLNVLQTAINKKDIQIGTVDTGNINATVNASGKIIPLNEEIIIAPINSRIVEVYKNSGDSVSKNQPILKLELASVETEYNQKLDEREMRKGKLLQSRIGIENKISEMEMQYRVKEMQLRQMKTDLANEHYLDSIGASTRDKIREKELNFRVATLELEQLKQKIANERRNSVAEQKVQQLDFTIFEKSLEQSARLLRDSRILAPMNGTLTYVNNQIGSPVSVGTQIAILSDLSHFKVEAEIADTYADQLAPGAKAVVKIANAKLPGTVVNITPSSQNGVIKFIVMLENPDDKNLRSGLRVDAFVEHGFRENVLRIPSGIYYIGPGKYNLWVIKDGKAEKRSVTLGESSFEYVEVVSGLNKGEHVIISNMEQYKNKKSLKIK